MMKRLKENSKTVLPAASFLLLAAFAFTAAGSTQLNADMIPGMDENIETEANVVAYKNGEPVDVSHNVLMEGEEAIEEQLVSGEAINYNTIAVANGASPTDTSGSLDGEITANGLSPTSGTVTENSDGNYTVEVTYDVTGQQDVSTTALKSTGAGSAYDYFAGTDFGRTISLYDGDSLTVEWTVAVQNP